MRSKLITTAFAALMCMSSVVAFAATVTLTSTETGISLKGTLLEFDGDSYHIDSGLGVTSIPAAGVTCDGVGCPNSDKSTTGNLANGVAPRLLNAYGRAIGSETLLNASLETTSAGAVFGADSAAQDFVELSAGQRDMILSARKIHPDEADRLVSGGLDAIRKQGLEYVVASEGLVVVSDPSIRIGAISLRNLGRVYSGDIRNWAELGGPDLPITVFLREPGSASRDSFVNLVMFENNLTFSDRVIGVDNDTGISASVMAFPGAMGVIGMNATGFAQPMAIRDECGIDTHASPFSIQTGTYPLTNHLYAYRPPNSNTKVVDGLVQFLKTADGRVLLDDMGLIGQGIEVEDSKAQGERMVKAMAVSTSASPPPALGSMLETLATARRLSPTFRVISRGRQDAVEDATLNNLAYQLANGAFDGKEILFVGFTGNSDGDTQGNLLRTRSQAKRTMSELVTLDPKLGRRKTIRLRAIGYGAVSPLTCGDSETALHINNRVEIWVRDMAVK